MVVAKTSRALAVLSRHFRKRLVEKRYLALVHGVLEQDSGEIKASIGRDPDLGRWRVIDGAKPAETRFKILERLARATLLELEPVTGRTNQLRIHCAHIGHPIVGDDMHGNFESVNSNCGLKIGAQDMDPKFAIRNSQSEIRLCLHAWKLGLHHPSSGEWMEFRTPAPDDIVSVVKLFR
jgi:23S rRNA pseudouridine1911/1915/1917 synthase